MKPSNTGPWGCKCQTLHHRIAGDGCDECNPDMARQIEIDNAVDDAIAEYRKELAAKVEDAFCELKQALAEQGAIDAFDLACVENTLVDSIINENDDAE